MNAANRMAWSAAVMALVSGCAQPGAHRGDPHTGMPHGAVSSGTAGSTDQAGCPMMSGHDHRAAEQASKDGQTPAQVDTKMTCPMMKPTP